MATKRDWVSGAIKHPGAFSRKAKRAGKSVSAYARQVLKSGSKASEKTKKEARLAQTLARMRKKR